MANEALKFNRKLVLNGKSMIKNVELARELGYLKIAESMIIKLEDASKFPESQIVIITTGTQGEPFSGLVTMSKGENKSIKLNSHDAVLILASVIPGNEELVNNTINRLFSLGCEVVYGLDQKVHVSGHASSEELKLLINLVRPKYFVPIHGEQRHLVRHAQLAQAVGIMARNTFVIKNGDALWFNGDLRPKVIKAFVKTGAIAIDGNAIGELKSNVIKERRDMAENGLIIISAVINKSGKLLVPFETKSLGVLISEDKEKLFRAICLAAEAAIKDFAIKAQVIRRVDIAKVIRNAAIKVLKQRKSSCALILPVINILAGKRSKKEERECKQ